MQVVIAPTRFWLPSSDFGRTEENLFQRTGRADFDPCAARQIRVRRRHPNGNRRPALRAPCKCAPNHDGIRAAGERFANIAVPCLMRRQLDRNIARGFVFEVGRSRAVDAHACAATAHSKKTAR